MKFGSDQAVLLSDLNAQGFNLLNCPFIDDDGLVQNDDIRLHDPRPVIDGSVTDGSVADDAGIMQSKLSLNGTIPSAWLGGVNTTQFPIAAQGDLTEKIANKNVANGYPGLDVNMHMSPSVIPPGPGFGTLTDMRMLVPDGLFVRLTGAGTPTYVFDVYWYEVAPVCWFGINAMVQGKYTPVFNANPVPVGKVPALPASQFTSGTFDPGEIPVALYFGPGHHAGAVPDPGTDHAGHPSDYLARDMTYKPMTTGIAYQPTLSAPSVTFLYYQGFNAMVCLNSPVPGASLFCQSGGPFIQRQDHEGFLVPAGTHISVYSAKIGWNNSDIFIDIIPEPPEPPGGGTEPPPTP